MERYFAPSLLSLMLLASCGGGGSDAPAEIDALRAQAAAKEAEARALALDTPCAANNQCGGLVFGFTVAACGAAPQIPYSLISASARQAEAAAAEQRAIAARIMAMMPLPGIACPALYMPQPIVSCSANKCVQGQ